MAIHDLCLRVTIIYSRCSHLRPVTSLFAWCRLSQHTNWPLWLPHVWHSFCLWPGWRDKTSLTQPGISQSICHLGNKLLSTTFIKTLTHLNLKTQVFSFIRFKTSTSTSIKQRLHQEIRYLLSVWCSCSFLCYLILSFLLEWNLALTFWSRYKDVLFLSAVLTPSSLLPLIDVLSIKSNLLASYYRASTAKWV